MIYVLFGYPESRQQLNQVGDMIPVVQLCLCVGYDAFMAVTRYTIWFIIK